MERAWWRRLKHKGLWSFIFSFVTFAPALAAAGWMATSLWPLVHPMVAVCTAMASFIVFCFGFAKSRLVRGIYLYPYVFLAQAGVFVLIAPSQVVVAAVLSLAISLAFFYLAGAGVRPLRTIENTLPSGEVVAYQLSDFGDPTNIVHWKWPALASLASLLCDFAWYSLYRA